MNREKVDFSMVPFVGIELGAVSMLQVPSPTEGDSMYLFLEVEWRLTFLMPSELPRETLNRAFLLAAISELKEALANQRDWVAILCFLKVECGVRMGKRTTPIGLVPSVLN